jgi:hypothetical protein
LLQMQPTAVPLPAAPPAAPLLFHLLLTAALCCSLQLSLLFFLLSVITAPPAAPLHLAASSCSSTETLAASTCSCHHCPSAVSCAAAATVTRSCTKSNPLKNHRCTSCSSIVSGCLLLQLH